MSSLATEISSEKALELQITYKHHDVMICLKFKSFACPFQGTIFDNA